MSIFASGGWTSMKKLDLMYLDAKPPKCTSSNLVCIKESQKDPT
jgi:hypothetical protein